MQVPNHRVKGKYPLFGRLREHSEFPATRATLGVAPDLVGWYKVCAAIRETYKVQAITG